MSKEMPIQTNHIARPNIETMARIISSIPTLMKMTAITSSCS